MARENIIRVRLNDAELAKLTALAKKIGESVSVTLRVLIKEKRL